MQNLSSIFHDLSLIRNHSPLVHNIANFVAMPTIANMLLALGASPLMAHAHEELSDLGEISQTLVLNIGTLDRNWMQAMVEAQLLAHKKKTPIILDPVGAGASKYRIRSSLYLLKQGINILRGNASEIMALAGFNAETKGVDTTVDSLAAEKAAHYLAQKYSCVVVISGTSDVIVSPEQKCYVHKPPGSLFTRVTAMGCSASAIIGAFAAVNTDYFTAAVHAMIISGIAGEKAMAQSLGPGKFYEKLLDALYCLNSNDFIDYIELINNDYSEIRLKNRIKPKDVESNLDLSFYMIADCALCDYKVLPKIVENVLPYGISCVQLRGKNLSEKQFTVVGKKLLKILQPHKIPLIINDSIAIAKILNAAGVHLGQKDSSIDFARSELGPEKIIGLSVTNSLEAERAIYSNADYFGVGPVFTTYTKSDATDPINLTGLRKIRNILRDKPVVAIGGINDSNAKEVLAAGVDGIAVASAVLSSPDYIAATKNLHAVINSHRQKSYPCILSIAGSDSSGGAGSQADIKTITATGGYAASVITALTAQNTVTVTAIHNIPSEFVRQQIDAVCADLDFSVVKIGMLHQPDIISVVADSLKKWHIKKIILDPVMVAKGGAKLITRDALRILTKQLFPLAYLLTPNLKEAEILVKYRIKSLKFMEKAAEDLAKKYRTNVLLKGGHLIRNKCDDILYCYATRKLYRLSAARITSNNTHGTGCTLSAAIASYLAQENDLITAVCKAKDYVSTCIRSGSNYRIGHGHGPLKH